MRAATPAEIDRWDELVVANPDGGHMLQSRAWAELKRTGGWRPVHLVSNDPGLPLATLLLRREVPGLGGLWYAPRGPGVASAHQLGRVLESRAAFAGAFCVQVEPELADNPANRLALLALGLRRSEDTQTSAATAVVDLSAGEGALEASFTQTARDGIGLAERHGVTVRQVPCDEGGVATMHALVAAASGPGGRPLGSLEHHARCWRLFEASGQGGLFLARLDGEVLAGAFVGRLGSRGWCQDAGSVTHRREVEAPHLVQWEAMRWLREQGVRRYDLLAVPDRARMAATDHAPHALSELNRSFTRDVREFVGAWDLVLDERRYRLWRRAGEALVGAKRAWKKRRSFGS